MAGFVARGDGDLGLVKSKLAERGEQAARNKVVAEWILPEPSPSILGLSHSYCIISLDGASSLLVSYQSESSGRKERYAKANKLVLMRTRTCKF